MIDELVKETIKKHALMENPKECCGLIVSKDNNKFAFPCKNFSETPNKTFAVSANDYLTASKKGDVIAFYHSHMKNLNFSEFDKLNSENHKLPAIVYSIEEDDFNYYNPNGYEIPFINREYVMGYMDCFTLIRDYYSRELNIEIQDIDNKYRWIERRKEHPDAGKWITDLLDHFLNNDFIEVKESKKYDVILCKTSFIKSPIHCLLWLDNNQFLHHPWGRKSCIEIYNNYWKFRTLYRLRHKSLL